MISLRDVVTGFGNRDPLAEVWRRSLRGSGGGSAVITGVPPLRYIGDGRPLTDYLISGNAVQDGTPTPEAPVDATGSGVRTGNLATSVDATTSNNIYIHADKSEMASNTPYSVSFYSDVTFRGNSIYLNTYNPSYSRLIGTISGSGQVSSAFSLTDSDISAIDNASQFLIRVYKAETDFSDTKNIMLNLGSTALPYEPYGYKLPFTVNGTEYPIYLGTVPTTRRVKKLVLTGEEEIAIRSGNAKWFIPIADLRVPTMASILWYCSHYQAVANNAPWASYDYMISWSTTDTGSSKGLRIRDVNFLTGATVADFKSYLAAQYQNGTPVTVWYVLAEPETAVVNEPLMKIGEYADTISAAQAGVTIPTVSGENILDVPTTVPPSEITIKGGISSV